MDGTFIKYIQNEDHYSEVVSKMFDVKHDLWIGTADIKDLYVNHSGETIPLVGVMAKLLKRGVSIRLIHAKEPGEIFRTDFDKYPILASNLERVLCPRVHFKMIVLDLDTVYIGSANLTGAGIGMKGENKRNFEAGILTNDKETVSKAMALFDNVWMGGYCKKCGRKEFCSDRIS